MERLDCSGARGSISEVDLEAVGGAAECVFIRLGVVVADSFDEVVLERGAFFPENRVPSSKSRAAR